MRLIITLVPVLALAGCMTQEEAQNRNSASCVGYGFRPGTTEFAQCMQNEAILQEERKQRTAAALRSLSTPPAPASRVPQSTKYLCTTYSWGTRCRPR
jgi:hypothetical protein